MKRRSFFAMMGLGTAAVVVAPISRETKATPVVEKLELMEEDGLLVSSAPKEMIWPRFSPAQSISGRREGGGHIPPPILVSTHYMTFVPFRGKYFIVRKVFGARGFYPSGIHKMGYEQEFRTHVLENIKNHEKLIN